MDQSAAAIVVPTDQAWPSCRLCTKPFRPGTGRGPGGTACSRSKCRKATYGITDKDARIAELENVIIEKNKRIAELECSQYALISAQHTLISALPRTHERLACVCRGAYR